VVYGVRCSSAVEYSLRCFTHSPGDDGNCSGDDDAEPGRSSGENSFEYPVRVRRLITGETGETQ